MKKILLVFVVAGLWPGWGNAQEKPFSPQESVAMALRQSPQARAALFARDIAQIQADREKPVARPTFSAAASGTLQGARRTIPFANNTTGVVLPDAFAQVSLTVEQILYRPGLGAARQRYTAQSAAVQHDLRRTLSEIALDVHKAYLDVLRAESGRRQAQEGQEAAERYRGFVRKQIDAGLAKPVDAQTAAGQVAEAASGVTKASGGLLSARRNFNRLLGRPLEEPFRLEPLAALPTVPESAEAAVASALQNRPEIAALNENLRAAQAGVSLAKTQAQPTLSVRGHFAEQTATALLPPTFAAATLEIRWPFGDGGKTKLDTQEAQAQALRLEALREDAKQGILLEVLQAHQKMKDAQSSIALAEEQQKGAEATAAVAEKAYEVGRGTVLEVQAAQRELRNARERLLLATFDLHTAAAEFAHAQGILLPASSLSGRNLFPNRVLPVPTTKTEAGRP